MSNVKDIITEMKLMLNNKPSYTLSNYLSENFRLPESYEEDFSDEMSDEVDNVMPRQNEPEQQMDNSKVSGIEKELTQIRKIALNVITRLADQPSSEQYQLMKKIWDTVDRAIESSAKNTKVN